MITEESIRLAAEMQPGRYILYFDEAGRIEQFDDRDSGHTWFKLPDGVWAWVC